MAKIGAMMSTRTTRPKAQAPLCIRFDSCERATLRRLSVEVGVPMAQLIRTALDSLYGFRRLVEEERRDA